MLYGIRTIKQKKEWRRDMEQKRINKPVFFTSVLLLAAAIVCMIAIPETTAAVVNRVFTVLTYDFGWLYLLIFVICCGAAIWIGTSKYGTIRLGDEEKQYSESSWTAMMFTAGLGVGLIVQSFVEPLYFLSSPPFHIEPMSDAAFEYAHMYSQYLWGPMGWACYVPATIAVAWVLYIKKKPVLRLSAACEPVLGKHVNGALGKVIDTIVVVGMAGGNATSLGLGVPIVATIFCHLTGIENTIWLTVGILVAWFLVFGTATFLGMDKGVKMLSTFNMYTLFVFIGVVLLVSPILDILNLEMNSIGLMIDNLGMLVFGTDPITKSGFPQNWTVFYWAWMLTFVPMMALFTARISRGRTIRQVVFGEAIYGGMGCMSAFALFGGYSLHLQRSGAVDLVRILAEEGREEAIVAILETLPLHQVMMVVYVVLLFLFLATTIDSTSMMLASVCTDHLQSHEEPARWNRVLWSLLLMLLALGLSVVGGLHVIQTASLVVGAPLAAVAALCIVAVRRQFKEYCQKEK